MPNSNTASKLQEEYRTRTPEEKAYDFMTMLQHMVGTDPQGRWPELYNIALQLNTEDRAAVFDYMLTLCAGQGE